MSIIDVQDVIMLSASVLPPPAPSRQKSASFGISRVFVKGEAIFTQGDASGLLYQVMSGTIRTSRLLRDGRRQVDDFHLPGDIFGTETSRTHGFSADAIETATVLSYPRSRHDCLASDDRDLGLQTLAAAMLALERTRTHMVLLGRKNATEKVASFLLDLSERLCDDQCIDLPMSRTDIADYLGLTIETVSRTFCQLEREGVIELPDHRRCVVLRDRSVLRRLDA